MNIFLDPVNKLVIVSGGTKASKILNQNYETFNLIKVIGNISKTMSKTVIDFTTFGYPEDTVTAANFLKSKE